MPYPPKLMQAAHAALINPQERILLVQGYYGKNKETPSKRWMLPGGRREKKDSNLIDACYRELGEELGLTSANFGTLRAVDCFDWGHPKRAETIFLGRMLGQPELRLQENEIHHAKWFTQQQVQNLTFINPKFKTAVEKAFSLYYALNIIDGFHVLDISNTYAQQ